MRLQTGRGRSAAFPASSPMALCRGGRASSRASLRSSASAQRCLLFGASQLKRYGHRETTASTRGNSRAVRREVFDMNNNYIGRPDRGSTVFELAALRKALRIERTTPPGRIAPAGNADAY